MSGFGDETQDEREQTAQDRPHNKSRGSPASEVSQPPARLEISMSDSRSSGHYCWEALRPINNSHSYFMRED